jgi:DNA adenine methylase
MNPFLKWAGGKRWLTGSQDFTLPQFTGRYFEPFLGSGAVFFSSSPRSAVLSDVNERLIETYIAVRDEPTELLQLLAEMHHEHSKEFYYGVRSQKYHSGVERAAQFIYLNRTCWNGLYRENLKGEFNVPIGTKSDVIGVQQDLVCASKLLHNAELVCIDFEIVVDSAQEGDLIFADPPYTVAHNNNGFVKYNERIFSWSDQIRLRDCLQRARDRGVKIALTNADHESIRDLYRGWSGQSTLQRSSVLAAESSRRGKTTELLIGDM